MKVIEVDPVRIRPGRRPQALRWAVCDGEHVVAVFASEGRATAYKMRIERIKREMETAHG